MLNVFTTSEVVNSSDIGWRGRRRRGPAGALGAAALAFEASGLALFGRAAHACASAEWRASQSSRSTAAARESSEAVAPPLRCAMAVVKRSS